MQSDKELEEAILHLAVYKVWNFHECGEIFIVIFLYLHCNYIAIFLFFEFFPVIFSNSVFNSRDLLLFGRVSRFAIFSGFFRYGTSMLRAVYI